MASRRLASTLRTAGHDVETPQEAGTTGRPDAEHLEHTARAGRVLVTRNPSHFLDLHARWQAAGRRHSGILVVYLDNIRGKDMQPDDVAHAIRNLIASGLAIANNVHVLNHWR